MSLRLTLARLLCPETHKVMALSPDYDDELEYKVEGTTLSTPFHRIELATERDARRAKEIIEAAYTRGLRRKVAQIRRALWLRDAGT